MSLKAFHVIFITAAILMTLGCAVWALKAYWSPEGTVMDLLFGIGSVVAAIGLVVYERYFLKKLKNVSYL
jgi:hypothetical protein